MRARRVDVRPWRSSRRLSPVPSSHERRLQERSPRLQPVAPPRAPEMAEIDLPALPPDPNLAVVTTVAHLERDLAELAQSAAAGGTELYERMLARLVALGRQRHGEAFAPQALEEVVARQGQLAAGEGAVRVVDGDMRFAPGTDREATGNLFLGLFIATVNRWLRCIDASADSAEWRDLIEVFVGELAREVDRINDQGNLEE